MPTASQFRILRKIGCDGNVRTDAPSAGATGQELQRHTSARAYGLQRAAEIAHASAPVYVPPMMPKLFTLSPKEIELQRLRKLQLDAEVDGRGQLFFPEMASVATMLSKPGKATTDLMTADDIMKRLHELGWRREGEGQRFAEERRRKEEERRQAEEEEAARRNNALDLVNDPLLRRVKEKSQKQRSDLYARPPDRRPFAVCFDLQGPSVTHAMVKQKLDELFRELDDSDIKGFVSLEYQPRAMHVKRHDVGNRWVITLESLFGAAKLDGCKIAFGKQEAELKRYDEVMEIEFTAYTRQSKFKQLFNMD